MHATVYSKPFFPLMGGLERNSLTLCLALQDLGHRVRLLTETCRPSEQSFPFEVVRTTNLRTMATHIGDTDLLLVNGNVSLRTLPLAYLQGIPYGIIYHNYVGYRRPGETWKVKLENKARNYIANKSKYNIFTNTYSKENSDLPEPTSHVLLNPVDKQLQTQYAPRGDSTEITPEAPFLFAGRLIEGKGIFVLADALKKLDGSLSFRVEVAGEGRDKAALRKRTSGLSTINVDVLGRLNSRDLVEAYQRSRALVVPSTTHKEGNPLVIAEAMYARVPVIASDQPPMIESVGNAGLIVEQGNVTALAAALKRLVQDVDFLQSLRAKARQRASLFSYQTYVDNIQSIINT